MTQNPSNDRRLLDERDQPEPVVSDNSVVVFGYLRGTIVVVQHATDTLASAKRSSAIRSLKRLNQLVVDALMVPFAMVVGHELCYRASQMPLP